MEEKDTSKSNAAAAAAAAAASQQQQDPAAAKKKNETKPSAASSSPLLGKDSKEEYDSGSMIPAVTQSASFPEQASSLSVMVVGSSSITGHRSDSGTMTIDERSTRDRTVAAAAALRLRANTAPTVLLSNSNNNNHTDASQLQPQQQQQSSSSSSSSNQSPAEQQTSAAAKSPSPAAAAAVVDEEEDDEEIRIAMAMALAIQNNPNLTPDEIHQLVGAQQQPQQQTTTAAGTTTTTNRFTSMFHGAAAAAAETKKTTTPGAAAFNVFREKAVGRFSEIAAESRGILPFRSTTTATTTKSTRTTTEQPTAAAVVAAETSKLQQESVITTAPPPKQQQQQQQPPANKVAAAADAAASAAKPAAAESDESSSAKPSTPRTNTSSTLAATKTDGTDKPTATAVNKKDDNDDVDGKVVPRPIEAAANKVLERVEGTVVANVVTHPPVPAGKVVATAGLVVEEAKETIATKTANIVKSSSPPPFVPQQGATEKGMMMMNMFTKQQQQQTTSSSSLLQQPPKPRLTGVAWKRRGGMGKFSATSAWERRRIALTGTKLMYYLLDDESEYDNDDSSNSHNTKDFIPSSSSSSVPAVMSTGNSAEQRRTSWFETAAASVSWQTASSTTLEPEASTPRGFLDIAKEKATVNAAFGHSGAPTPFALSIKVKSETKWKLCFDRHSVCMEWLAAITDVVVQCSVDSYNAALLEAADPANVSDFALFHPPRSPDGPATRDGPGAGKGHQLWMLEKYRIQSEDWFDNDADDDDSEPAAGNTQKTTTIVEEQEEEETVTETMQLGAEYNDPSSPENRAAQDTARDDAPRKLVLPQENLLYAAAVTNFAMLLARASSTTVDSFWQTVVFCNLGVFLCLIEHPDWRSILERVRAAPTTNAAGQQLLQKAISKKISSTVATTAVSAGEQVEPSLKPTSGFVPKAGCSTVKLDEPTDTPKNQKGEMFAGWRSMPGETLMVRSHGYADTKKKVPSPGELYECVAVDVFESPQRYPDMGPRVKLPTVNFDDGGAPKTWRSPDIFIISIALPTDPPKMGRTSSDGGGYTVTMYYQMKRETRDILRRVTADDYDPSTEKVGDPQKSKVNAVRLLEEWIRRSPSDPKFQARFKVVPNAHNLKEIGMPGWISKYNGKPFLIKRAGVTGFLEVHPELSCVEFDISLHPFPYLAKQGICFMKESYFKKVLVSFGFVIEGRADDELPECLIGLMQLCYPDPQYAIQAVDFFNGTAPRSF